MIPMVGGKVHLIESLLNLFRTPKTAQDLVGPTFGDLAMRPGKTDSPYAIALHLREDPSVVDEAFELLADRGLIRLSEKQLVVPTGNDGIPHVFARYVVVGMPA